MDPSNHDVVTDDKGKEIVENVAESIDARKIGKMCNVKDVFPVLEIPLEKVHVVKCAADWQVVEECFLNAVHMNKVVGYHSIYQLTSSIEVRPSPTSILQLASVGGLILILQLNQLPEIPASLKKLLADPQILKVGVHAYNLARRLEKDRNLRVSGTLDLRALSEQVDRPSLVYMSLPDFSKAILGKQLGIVSNSSRAISARISYWHRETLREDQIHYAAVFPYSSLQIFIDLVGLKIKDFRSKIEDGLSCSAAWEEAETVWSDTVNQNKQFTAFHCDICDASPNVEVSYNQHLAGHRHRKSVEKLQNIETYGELGDQLTLCRKQGSVTTKHKQPGEETKEAQYCAVCDVTMSTAETMTQHLNGQKHRKKVKQKMVAGEKVEDHLSIDMPEPNVFTCRLCDLTVPTKESMDFHLAGRKHRKKLKQVELREEDTGQPEVGEAMNIEVDQEEKRRYCQACEVMVHNNECWLNHKAGKKHKQNKESLDRLEKQVTCNAEFGAKRPALEDLSGSVYCGICNTTVMATKCNLEHHFQGKKHQTRLKEKNTLEAAKPEALPEAPVPLSARMKDIARSVVGKVTAADVGEHEQGIYCKVCRTILLTDKSGLQAHLMGKKHLKNQQVLGKHNQPFKFPKARNNPYQRPVKRETKPAPWQTSDIDDAYKIPGVPVVDFERQDSPYQPQAFPQNEQRYFNNYDRRGWQGPPRPYPRRGFNDRPRSGFQTRRGWRGPSGGSWHPTRHGGSRIRYKNSESHFRDDQDLDTIGGMLNEQAKLAEAEHIASANFGQENSNAAEHSSFEEPKWLDPYQ